MSYATTVSEGAYYLRNCAADGLLLDVNGGSDAWGTNVQVWEQTNSDAQIFALVQNGTGWMIYSALLAGMAVDVENGVKADGTNVRAWDANKSGAQTWRLVLAGTDSFNIFLASTYGTTNQLCLGLASGAAAKSGADVRLRSYTDDASQRWRLEYLAPIPSGTYEIVSALDTGLALDVRGGSTANGTPIQVYTRNDGESQRFLLKATSDDNGLVNIIPYVTASGSKKVDASGNGTVDATAKGASVQLWESTGSHNQNWLMVRNGTVERNGVDYPAYAFRCEASKGTDNLQMDVYNANREKSTKVIVWPASSDKNQAWDLIPKPVTTSSLASPTSGGLAPSSGGAATPRAAVAAGSFSQYLTWVGDGADWKVRYRTRTRTASMSNNERSAWGNWQNVYGSLANSGLDSAVQANCATASGHGRKYSPKPVTGSMSASGTDLTEVQFEVTRFLPASKSANGFACQSGTLACTAAVALKPAVALNDFEYGGSGCTVAVKVTGVARGGNTVALTAKRANGSALFTNVSFSNVAAGEGVSLTVPPRRLSGAPTKGEAVKVTATVLTCDSVSSGTASASLTCQYEGQRDDFGTLSASGTTASFKTDKSDVSAWLVVPYGHGKVQSEVDDLSRILPPIGGPWQLMVKDNDLGKWQVFDGEELSARGYRVASPDGSRELVVELSQESPGPRFQPTYQRAHNAFTTSGREREVVTFGATTKAAFTLKGDLVGDSLDAMREEFDYIVHCGHAVFRSPAGYWARVAVESGTIDYSGKRSSEVSLDLREETI